MTISIRSAFKNTLSEQYNKLNIFVYLILAIIAQLSFTFIKKGVSNETIITAVIVFLIFSLLTSGINMLGVHNLYREKKSVFPSIVDDFANILLISLKALAGALLNGVIFGIIIGIILFVLSFMKLQAVVAILGIILYFALILLTITLNFQFLTTLKFKEYFNYKKVFKTIISNIKSFIIYIFKIIVIIIAVVLIDLCITIPIGFIFGVSSIVPIANPAVSTSNAIIISSLIATIIGGLGSIITLDLTGQFVRIIFPREKQ